VRIFPEFSIYDFGMILNTENLLFRILQNADQLSTLTPNG